MGTGDHNAGGEGGGGEVTLRWTSIPSREEWQYSQSLHATETGVKRRPDGPLSQ